MRKQLFILGLFLATNISVFSQSGTITPERAEFINNLNIENDFAVKGIMSNNNQGNTTAALRGHNNTTGNSNSSGVHGSVSTGGRGVFGESLYGTGVYGLTSGGYAIQAIALSGIGLYSESANNVAARFHIEADGNHYPAVEIQTKGNGHGLDILTFGNGAGTYIRKVNTNGNGPGFFVNKTYPYYGGYTIEPHADLEVRHASGFAGMSGIRIFNTDANLHSWTLYTNNSDGALQLYAKGVHRGSFNAATGVYTNISDVRLKNHIRNYKGTLDKIMKIGVKSYQLINSDKTEIGLMAQEIVGYFPEIVYQNTSPNGEQFYTMDYSRIGVLAIKAIQEQQAIIQKQQKEINALKDQVKAIDTMKQEIEELKRLVRK